MTHSGERNPGIETKRISILLSPEKPDSPPEATGTVEHVIRETQPLPADPGEIAPDAIRDTESEQRILQSLHEELPAVNASARAELWAHVQCASDAGKDAVKNVAVMSAHASAAAMKTAVLALQSCVRGIEAIWRRRGEITVAVVAKAIVEGIHQVLKSWWS
ncbi:MAG: hypothetical protein AB7G17_06150 [Phycisphaerales bacterium]